MSKIRINKARESRIDEEIIVDCYDEAERAMGWYYYLEDRLKFPFAVTCVAKRSISPLKPGDMAEVIGMAPEEEYGHEMFVMIQWERRKLALPLAQLEVVKVNKMIRQAVEDWRYWAAMGYEF
jgi:hypothetical protein